MTPTGEKNNGLSDVGSDVPAGSKTEEIPVRLGHGIDETTSSVKFKIYLEQLLAKPPREERVCATSSIEEVRTFSKRDILEAIVSFAMSRKLELEKAEISLIVTNEQGTILVLEVKVPGVDGSYQLINFTIKGRHERNESGTTNIDRTFWDKDDMPEGGDIIVEYLEGKWSFIK